MRETVFIRQNEQKWAEYEAYLNQAQIDPDHLRQMFVHITDDLAYARTFYRNRSVHFYLNGLAQRIFSRLRRGYRQSFGQVLTLWTEDVPRILWETRRALWLSFGVFVLSFAIGVVSSRIDPSFAHAILGEEYVRMTVQNIEEGDPMAVYKASPPLIMSAGIAANNIVVALMMVLSGVLTSIGTVFILIRNGVMVGAFQYFFVEFDLFWPSFLTIWIHGTLEISALIVAGAAGLVVGSGWLFPGTYTRRQAFQRSARRGFLIFLGLIPVFLLAAFFEGYLTRHTEVSDELRLAFILLSLALAIGYFVLLPWWKARRGHFESSDLREPLPVAAAPIAFTTIKNNAAILVDAFRMMLRHPKYILAFGLLTSGVVVVAYWIANAYGSGFRLGYEEGYAEVKVSSWLDGLSFAKAPLIFSVEASMLVLLTLAVLMALRREMLLSPFPVHCGRWSLPFAMGLLGICAMVLWLSDALGQLRFLLFPLPALVGFWLTRLYFGGKHVGSLLRTLALRSLVRSGLIGAVLAVLYTLLVLFFDSSLMANGIEFFSWLVPANEESLEVYYQSVQALLSSFALHAYWSLAVLVGAFRHFSDVEAEEALHLRQSIERIGTRPRIRGLTRE